MVRSQVHNSVPEWSDMSICGPFSGSTSVNLSGATCLYVVRSQVHNSVNLSGATYLYVVRSQVHNSVS